jgi:hypothetical protein
MPEPRGGAQDRRDRRNEARGQAQPGENEEREDDEVGRTGRKGGDDATVLVVRVVRSGDLGVVGVIVRARRMTVGARVVARRFGVEKLMCRRIGGEPGQQPREPHGQPCDGLPEETRAAARVGAVEAEEGHFATEHTEVVNPPLTTLLECSNPPVPTPAELHKVNHLLSHVLAAAVARRWPQINAGESGETCEGFFGDFAFEPVPPTAEELALLEGDMRQILAECRRFEHRNNL